ncbi:MAG: hypothetical protein HXY24_12235 [Rubrivivax sp.]|nr:hypothetical protein [Rubrivivax sp.]
MFNRFRFAQACSGILATPPVKLDRNSNLMLFSQLQHKDVLLALLAVKSFVSRTAVGAIRILNDGSLTPSDFALLRSHLPGVEFVDLEEVRSAHCPTGGCWERLLWIARLTRDHYVIQLDSDTLTLADIPEVRACVDENRSFVIGTWDRQDFEPMTATVIAAKNRMASQQGEPHVQLLAEANFDGLDRYHDIRYVRGCAGFSGFASGSVDRTFIETISQQMGQIIGKAWHRWGSEQVMSNIVVANDPSAMVLPHPKYCDCTKLKEDIAVFVHFIGACRFTGDAYQRLANQVIGPLRRVS